MPNNTGDASKVVTGKVRLSYPHIWEPFAFNEGEEPKYSATILIPKTDKATIAKIRSAQQSALEAGKDTKFGGKIPKIWADSLHDGDTESDTDEHPELAGMMYMAVTSRSKPGIVDQNVQPVMDQSEVYAGCYVRVSLWAFPYDYAGKKGVSFVLKHVQKMSDGEPFGGGGSKAEDDFEAVAVDDDDLI